MTDEKKTENEILTEELFRERICRELALREAQGTTFVGMMSFSYVESCAADRSFTLRFTPGKWTLNLYGTVNGGITASFADISMGILCRSVTGDNYIPTVDFQMHYLKTFLAGESILCRAKMVHFGGHILTTSCELYVGDSRDPSAIASATYARTGK